MVFSAIALILFVAYMQGSKRQIPLVFSNKEMLEGLWNSYKDTYLEPETYRTLDKSRDNLTTSEGEAYTMLRAVWVGDRDIFDKSALWSKNNLKRKNDNLYSWLFGKRSDGTYGVITEQGGQNSASDADTDIALAYVFAYARWKDEAYLSKARLILSDIWKYEVIYVGNKPYLAADNVEKKVEKSSVLMNPSYFAPYAYRIFAEVDKKHPWSDLVATSYDVILKSITLPLNKGQSAKLPPDWIEMNKATGNIFASGSRNLSTNYSFDAMRVPWRVALDYLWNRDFRAVDALSHMKILDSIWESERVLGSSYSHDGKLVLPVETPSFYGANIGYFLLASPQNATEMYKEKLLALYDPDRDSWKDDLSYYDSNWAWFGIALYNDELPNLAKGTFENAANASEVSLSF